MSSSRRRSTVLTAQSQPHSAAAAAAAARRSPALPAWLPPSLPPGAKMDRPKRGCVEAGLPDDALVEILARVPAKSLCRFKCVSRVWRDLINDPHHRKKLPQAMEGLFYYYTKAEISEAGGSKADYFTFIDLAARSVPPDIDPCFSFLTELPEIEKLVLLDSCNGLILFEHLTEREDIVGYIVCNPTTKQWRAVQNSGWRLTFTYLAFDPAASPHFHLLEFALNGMEAEEELMSLRIYSSEIGTWSYYQEQGQMEGWHHQARPCFELFWCAYVNGMLHLIAWDRDQHQQLILAVDVQGKTRRMIAVPDIANASPSSLCYFGHSQGCLHCITKETLDVHETSYKLSIWVLQDYNTQEWVLKGTLSSLELFGETSCRGDMLRFEVVDIHRDGNVVFFIQFMRDRSLGDKLLAYDMGHKQVSVIANFKNKFH